MLKDVGDKKFSPMSLFEYAGLLKHILNIPMDSCGGMVPQRVGNEEAVRHAIQQTIAK